MLVEEICYFTLVLKASMRGESGNGSLPSGTATAATFLKRLLEVKGAPAPSMSSISKLGWLNQMPQYSPVS